MFKWLKWLGLGLAVGVLALGLSVKTYIASLNRQEVLIAEATSEVATTSAYFQVRKFNDYNANGKRDPYEDSTNKAWSFQYQISGGSWKAITTAVDTGLSPFVAVAPGKKVSVEETTKSGWKITTPKTQTQTLSVAGQTYTFDFGNQQIGKVYFQVHKFNDLNGDGDKDSDEGSPNIAWNFQYKINTGDWQSISTNAAAGLSPIITVTKGNKITVEEYIQSGWKLTTPKTQTQTLSTANKTYAFDFGNQQTTASPSPNASPSPTNQPTFVIHKFLDANKNGVRETGEAATNRTWEFEYQINGGEKQEYMIEPGEEEGEKIMIDKGAKVKVSELGQEGWLNTTGAELTKTLTDPKLYTFYFGNWPVDGVGGAPVGGFPPTQPDTGTPTWLTLGAAGLAAVLLIVKWLWL